MQFDFTGKLHFLAYNVLSKWKVKSLCFAFHNRNKHLYLSVLGNQLGDKKDLAVKYNHWKKGDLVPSTEGNGNMTLGIKLGNTVISATCNLASKNTFSKS